ncbi:MAG TPA: trypsin-like peptidase domain-containing protein [Vicinamibacterales bacterium]|nr:trypsin-like peptidase domain-containing protein [Vicinamibacterales bacterium]
MSTGKTSAFYAILIAVAGMAVGMVIASRLDLPSTSSAQAVAIPAMNSAPLSGPIDATTFRNIAKFNAPAVVNIQTQVRQRGRDLTEYFGGQGGDDLLRRFFGGDEPQTPPSRRRGSPRPPEPIMEGAGTGFIIDSTGFILTNNHVVEGAETIRVSLFGGERLDLFAAKVVGHDSLTDTALLQLTDKPRQALTAIKFGDSEQMQPGDWVMAIGNPFRLGHSVSVGVISALGRPLGGVLGREQNMLQTDAAINPGNSGGPLLNVRGEVIGMNTAIYTDQRSANIGIGFATPTNAIRDLLPQLRNGKVIRGVIGVEVSRDHLTEETAKAFGLPSASGAVINSVNPNGPADKAGIQPGDVIIEFAGKPVKDSDSLVAMVVNTKPGTSVPVVVYRNNQRKSLNVVIDVLDLEAEQSRGARRGGTSPNESTPTATGFGMTLDPITPDIARRLDLPSNAGGAIVSDLERNSPAVNGGVLPGDVILEVNRQKVANVSQITRELQKAQPGQPVFMLVWRDGNNVFVTMTKR